MTMGLPFRENMGEERHTWSARHCFCLSNSRAGHVYRRVETTYMLVFNFSVVSHNAPKWLQWTHRIINQMKKRGWFFLSIYLELFLKSFDIEHNLNWCERWVGETWHCQPPSFSENQTCLGSSSYCWTNNIKTSKICITMPKIDTLGALGNAITKILTANIPDMPQICPRYPS